MGRRCCLGLTGIVFVTLLSGAGRAAVPLPAADCAVLQGMKVARQPPQTRHGQPPHRGRADLGGPVCGTVEALSRPRGPTRRPRGGDFHPAGGHVPTSPADRLGGRAAAGPWPPEGLAGGDGVLARERGARQHASRTPNRATQIRPGTGRCRLREHLRIPPIVVYCSVGLPSLRQTARFSRLQCSRSRPQHPSLRAWTRPARSVVTELVVEYEPRGSRVGGTPKLSTRLGGE